MWVEWVVASWLRSQAVWVGLERREVVEAEAELGLDILVDW